MEYFGAKTVFVAASGTGGHLFPAIYVAEALREISPSVEIVFIGSGRPLEQKIFSRIPDTHYEVIPMVGLKNRGLKGALQFIQALIPSLRETAVLFGKYKPAAVIGMGGYVAALPVLFAWGAGLPTWIHEAELRPGWANYFLSFFATRTSLAFKNARMPPWARPVFTGHPLRRDLFALNSSQPLVESPKNVLVMGGSQGARVLDETFPSLIPLLRKFDIEILHQCRAESVTSVKAAYEHFDFARAEVVPFIDDMARVYRWADVVVSRSGAGSVIELQVVNKPAVLVPLALSKKNEQFANARVLQSENKALVVEEGAEFDIRLGAAVSDILNLENYNRMRSSPSSAPSASGALQIAEKVIQFTSVR